LTLSVGLGKMTGPPSPCWPKRFRQGVFEKEAAIETGCAVANLTCSVRWIRWRMDANNPVLVSELELTVRASNCLFNANIITVRQLVQKTEAELLKIRNFGLKSLKDIKEQLKAHGLRLATKLEVVAPSPLCEQMLKAWAEATYEDRATFIESVDKELWSRWLSYLNEPESQFNAYSSSGPVLSHVEELIPMAGNPPNCPVYIPDWRALAHKAAEAWRDWIFDLCKYVKGTPDERQVWAQEMLTKGEYGWSRVTPEWFESQLKALAQCGLDQENLNRMGDGARKILEIAAFLRRKKFTPLPNVWDAA
jgi:hypothetical protein